MSTSSATQTILQRVFGYDTFRGPQQAIIEHVAAGHDALVLMPTGGGKSLCYQVPALLRKGIGVVISPLIALMQDQVETLRQLGVRRLSQLDPRCNAGTTDRTRSSHRRSRPAVYRSGTVTHCTLLIAAGT